MADVVTIDAVTGEVHERDFTPQEKAERNAEAEAAAKVQAEAAAKAASRQTALEKIAAASGLTPDEMSALGL